MDEVKCGCCKHMLRARRDGCVMRWGQCTAPVPLWVIDGMGEIRDKIWEDMGEECQMFAAQDAAAQAREERRDA